MIDVETGEIIGLPQDGAQYADIPKPAPFIRTRNNYDMDHASRASGLVCTDPSKAQQHDKDDADINTLVRRFGITGQIPVLDRVPLESEIFHDITDFHSAMNAIRESETTFMTLPADLRARFDNDPHAFLKFTSDEKNRDEMRTLGLLKPETPKPGPIEVVLAKPAGDPPAT